MELTDRQYYENEKRLSLLRKYVRSNEYENVGYIEPTIAILYEKNLIKINEKVYHFDGYEDLKRVTNKIIQLHKRKVVRKRKRENI